MWDPDEMPPLAEPKRRYWSVTTIVVWIFAIVEAVGLTYWLLTR